MFRGSYTAGSVAFLLLSTTLPAFCLRIFPQNAGRRKVGRTTLPPGLLHTKPPRLPSRKPGRFVCFRGAFSGAHAKPCEGSFGKPRVCGEKFCPGVIANSIKGSPPRMRGKVVLYRYGFAQVGITPTYAGKRRSCCAFRSLPWDHPRRVCGEKTPMLYSLFCIRGSPPRMRGKD